MSIAKTISTLALATSFVSAGLLLAATESAVAKRGSAPNGASLQREAGHDQDSNNKKDHDRHGDRDHRKKDREGKHKDKGKDRDGRHADKKCGGKKKCPTPVVEPIRHPGGDRPPVIGTGTGAGGTGVGMAPTPGGTTLGDPGYNGPPAGSSSGASGAGSPAGPSRDPVENGSGTTIKPN